MGKSHIVYLGNFPSRVGWAPLLDRKRNVLTHNMPNFHPTCPLPLLTFPCHPACPLGQACCTWHLPNGGQNYGYALKSMEE